MNDTTKFDPNINTGVLWNFNDLSFDRDVVWAFERIEELETALDTAMRWFEDEVPPNIIEELRKVRGEQ